MAVQIKQGKRVLTNQYIASIFLEAAKDTFYNSVQQGEFQKMHAKLMFCVSVLTLYQNDEGAFRISGLRCKDRFCSICASIRAGKFAYKVSTLFSKFKNPHFLTLTYGQRQQDLLTASKDFKRRLLNLRQYKKGWWKKYIVGGFGSFEATFVKGEGWHLHQHFIIDIKPPDLKIWNTRDDGQYQIVTDVKQELERTLEIVGLGTISDIKPCDDSAIGELCKYIVKFTEFNDRQAVLEAYQLKGFRQIQSFGSMYGLIHDKDLETKIHIWRFVDTLKDFIKNNWSGLSPPSLKIQEATNLALRLGVISQIQFKEITA